MANPSDIGPSGVGTEVLRRKWYNILTEGAGVAVLTGEVNHIYTIISITVCEVSGLNAALFKMYINPDDNASNTIHLIGSQTVPYPGTFVWDTKIVMTETDKLLMEAEASDGTAIFDVWISYIDQEFA